MTKGSPLDAFTGTIARTKTGPLYQLGLAVVAFAMVMLPLIYIGLIALTAWLVFLHITRDTWLFAHGSGRGILVIFIMYLGPAVAGIILIFFMIKPFFAAKATSPEPVTLDREKEPLLFAFVQKICELVGAPMPARIDVDCQVNASASLQHGLWSRKLVLTVGLPLASGLDMRQFAGVLAHEFGHFAQGAGMRLTYIIRRINFWFARVVFERDSWDVSLERSSRESDWRIAIVLHGARGCVWVTRRILWALMHAGNGISCFMLRQMEYDADSYEAKLAGSDAFASTASQLRVLNVATQVAYEDVRQSWASNRLPENLPLLIDHKAGSLPAEVHQKLSVAADESRTRWFDTHPCDADRIKAVQQLHEPGVFQMTEPTACLFADFAHLSKRVTRHHYEKHLELKFTEKNLMSGEEILRESAASADADAMVRKFYGKVNLSIVPLLTDGELPPILDLSATAASWRTACRQCDEHRQRAEKISAEWSELEQSLPRWTAAKFLASAGFKLPPLDFGLPESATSPGELEKASSHAIDSAMLGMFGHIKSLDPFMSALRRRVIALLQIIMAKGEPDAPTAGEVADLIRLLAAVSTELSSVREIGIHLNAFVQLVQNRGNHPQPQQVDAEVGRLMVILQTTFATIDNRLKEFTYPFPHARGTMTVAAYARSEQPAENEWHRTFLDAQAHVERLFALNYRLIGRLFSLCAAAEADLEKK